MPPKQGDPAWGPKWPLHRAKVIKKCARSGGGGQGLKMISPQSKSSTEMRPKRGEYDCACATALDDQIPTLAYRQGPGNFASVGFGS